MKWAWHVHKVQTDFHGRKRTCLKKRGKGFKDSHSSLAFELFSPWHSLQKTDRETQRKGAKPSPMWEQSGMSNNAFLLLWPKPLPFFPLTCSHILSFHSHPPLPPEKKPHLCKIDPSTQSTCLQGPLFLELYLYMHTNTRAQAHLLTASASASMRIYCKITKLLTLFLMIIEMTKHGLAIIYHKCKHCRIIVENPPLICLETFANCHGKCFAKKMKDKIRWVSHSILPYLSAESVRRTSLELIWQSWRARTWPRFKLGKGGMDRWHDAQ